MIPTPTRLPGGMASPADDPERFAGIRRDYTAEDVQRLAGSFRIRHTTRRDGRRPLSGTC